MVEGHPPRQKDQQGDQIVISAAAYQSRIDDDLEYIASRKEISDLLTKQWSNEIYRKTFKGVPAAALANCIFAHRRS